MAKLQKKLKKNIKRVKEKQKKEYPLKNQIMRFVKTIYIILIMTILIYGITVIVNKTYKLKETTPVYDSSMILAGQTFSKLDKEYYVVFYDINSENEITSKISGISDKTIYKVDLSLGNNESVISIVGNETASNATELQINGATIMKISEGKNVEYIEGYDKVISYLKDMAN